MAIVRIEVELDDRGAIVNTRKLSDEFKRMPSAAKPAADEMKKLQLEQRRASDAADLLAQRLGVTLPEAARRTVAESKNVGRVLTGIFNVTLFATFGAILIQTISNLGPLIKKIQDWDGALKRARESQKQVNQQLLEMAQNTKDIRREIELLGVASVEAARIRMIRQRQDLEDLRQTLDILETQRKRLEEIAKQTREVTVGPAGGIAGVEPKTRLIPTQEAKAAKLQLDILNPKIAELRKLVKEAGDTLAKYSKELSLEEAEKAKQRTEELNELLKEQLEYRKQLGDQAIQAIARLDAERQKIEELNRATEKSARAAYREAVGADVRPGGLPQTAEEAIRRGEQINARRAQETIRRAEEQKNKLKQINEQIARDAEAKFERAAFAIEGFFDRVFLTARSFGDVMRQLWTTTVGYIVKQIARMVAAWWLGHRQMVQISAGGSPAAVPGLTAGSGGVVGGAVIPAVMAAGGNGGIPGGTVGTTGTGGIPGGTVGMAGLSAFRNLQLAAGITALGGLSLASYGIGRGSPLLGGIGGFLAGGGIGLGLQSTGMLSGLGIIGGFAGPIGAGIGAIIGIIGAIRARGRQKTASAGIHEQYMAAEKKILNDFSRYLITYDSATSGLASVYEAAVAQLQGLGGPGKQTIREIGPKYQAALRRLEDLERARGFRTTAIAGLPIPSFQSGGIAPTAGGGGAYLSWLHAGEAVLNRRAVAALGRRGVERLNRGEGVGGGDVNVHIHAVDARSFVDLVDSHPGAVVRVVRRVAKNNGVTLPF